MSELALEERVRSTFAAIGRTVPDSPPQTWTEAKDSRATDEGSGRVSTIVPMWRRKSGRTLLSIGIAVGLVGAGTAAAAASGAFDSRATKEFRQIAAVPEPASWGRLPGFDQKKVTFEITNPAPEGTTVSLWSYQVTPEFSCTVILESSPGEATFPGKPSRGGGGCGGVVPGQQTSGTTLPPPPNPTYGPYGSIWRSRKGNLYMLEGGATPTAASRLVLTYANGTTASFGAHHGYWAGVIPYDQAVASFTGVFFDASGRQLPGTEVNP